MVLPILVVAWSMTSVSRIRFLKRTEVEVQVRHYPRSGVIQSRTLAEQG